MNEVAGNITVVRFHGQGLDADQVVVAVNQWLKYNPDTEVIDMRFNTGENFADAIIIHRKE